MTWVLKERGDTGGTVRLEYRCPVHGLFAIDVPRAFSPDTARCISRDGVPAGMSCNELSNWVPTVGAARVRLGEVAQGKSDARPPEDIVMDTRPLADGMPLHEFRERRKKIHRDIALKHARSLRTR